MTIQVLLADDHPVVREGMRTLLERQRFQVVREASDGREACQLAQELRPQVAILDLVMPVLNGLDAAIGIEQTRANTNAILLIMYADEYHAGSIDHRAAVNYAAGPGRHGMSRMRMRGRSLVCLCRVPGGGSIVSQIGAARACIRSERPLALRLQRN